MGVPLNIYLLKDNYNINELTKCNHHLDINGKRLFYKLSNLDCPNNIKNFFGNNANITSKLQSKSISACLFIEVAISEDEAKAFLITFGYGSKTLNKDYIVNDFGLKVVLNACEKDSIRRVTKREIAKNSKLVMGQTPKASDFREFGFEPQSDLLSEITAFCDFDWINNNITGKENLRLNLDCDISTIDEKLISLYELYLKNDYKEKFTFLDKISIIRQEDLIRELDAMVVSIIKNRDYEKCFLAIPEFFDWTEYNNIKYPYQNTRSNNNHKDICIEEFFEGFNDSKIDSLLKGSFIIEHANDENKNFKYSFRECLLAEFVHNGKTYCIVNGDYYEVNDDYKQIVDSFYENNVATLDMPEIVECTENVENDYIERIKSDDLISLDKKLVYDGFTVEICDMLSTDKKMVHIKKYYGANALSHLFFQGLNSITLLTRSREFQNKVNEKLVSINREDLIIENFDPREYSLVFVILSKAGGRKPKISFFSKLSLKNTIEKLSDFGIQVYISGAKLNIHQI